MSEIFRNVRCVIFLFYQFYYRPFLLLYSSFFYLVVSRTEICNSGSYWLFLEINQIKNVVLIHNGNVSYYTMWQQKQKKNWRREDKWDINCLLKNSIKIMHLSQSHKCLNIYHIHFQSLDIFGSDTLCLDNNVKIAMHDQSTYTYLDMMHPIRKCLVILNLVNIYNFVCIYTVLKRK